MEMLRAACEQFLGKTSRQMMKIAKETLEGHQRAIMCTMSVEVNFVMLLICCNLLSIFIDNTLFYYSLHILFVSKIRVY